jgi:eukaryotic-like serine/threonine-protein kinase
MNRPRRIPAWCAFALTAVIAAFGGATSGRTQASQGAPETVLSLPQNEWITIRNSTVIAISPDGANVVWASAADGLLYVRPVAGGDGKQLPGTKGASSPFFSPDGKWIGYFAGGKLLKIAATGGTPAVLCDSCAGASAAWADDGIVFERGGLWKLPNGSDKPQPLTQLAKGEASHSWPDVLPGGKAVIFTNTTDQGWNDGQIVLVKLDTGERRVLVDKATTAKYTPPGHLLYVQGGELMAVPFSLDTLQVSGPAARVTDNVMESSTGTAHYSVSASGSLAYLPGGILGGDRTLVSVDRQGNEQPLDAPKRRYGYFRISPDGKTLAIEIDWPTIEIWLYSFSDHSLKQFTTKGGEFPWWAPGGAGVTYFSSRAGVANLFFQPVGDGTQFRSTTSFRFSSGSEPAQLTFSEYPVDHSLAWSPDGKTLAYTVTHPKTGMDIWMQPSADFKQAKPYLATSSRECCPVFSPDGHRVAFLSNVSGQAEVYVSPFPGAAQLQKVSSDGGVEPLWSKDGKELFYWSNDRKLMAADMTGASPGTPHALFGGTFLSAAASWRTRIDITPDGTHFILIRRGAQEDETKELHVVPNWAARLSGQPATK